MSEFKPDWKNWAQVSQEPGAPWRFRGAWRADKKYSREEFIEIVKKRAPLFRFENLRTSESRECFLYCECHQTQRYYVCWLENGLVYEAILPMSEYAVYCFPF
jgi:hypothetical protein